MVADKTMEQVYGEVEFMLRSVVRKFAKRFGKFDIDELVSLTNQAFMDAYDSFDDSKGAKFSTYVTQCAWNRMYGHYRTEYRHGNVSLTALKVDQRDCSPAPFNLSDFASELSSDAVTVLQLVLESPAELAEMAANRGGFAANIRSSVRTWLKDTGWTGVRIADSFEEIKGVLAGA